MSSENALVLYQQGLNGLDLVDEKRKDTRMDPAPRPQLHQGQEVTLNVPENLQLHGAKGRVLIPTEWGAHVATNAAATGQFRAMHSEIVVDGQTMTPAVAKAMKKFHSSKTAREKGYTGDCCQNCGSFRMKRNGACLVCDDCGESGGCS